MTFRGRNDHYQSPLPLLKVAVAGKLLSLDESLNPNGASRVE